MGLEKWVGRMEVKKRKAGSDDVRPLFNTFQRVRKLKGLEERFENVTLDWKMRKPRSPDEWAFIVDVRKTKEGFIVLAVPLGTADKAKAVRRAYGWGIRDEDGPVWPPEPDGPIPDEPHFPDVDEAAYFNYFSF